MDTAPGGDSWPFAFHGATGNAENTRIREAAWIARCVGRGASAPLTHDDVIAVAGSVGSASLPPGAVLFGADDPVSAGVWIVREGRVELSLGSGRLRVVVGVVRPGDVEGDIPLLLGRPLPYTARAVDHTVCLHLVGPAFEHLLVDRPAIGRKVVVQRRATARRQPRQTDRHARPPAAGAARGLAHRRGRSR